MKKLGIMRVKTKKEKTEELSMKLTYRTENGILFPNLELPEQTNYAIGKYGKMRFNFMKAHRKGTYTTILTLGRLNSYLHGIDEAAEAQLSKIISETAQRLGVTEQMKAENQLEWVRMMNNIKHSAEETVLKELIYV